MKKRFYTFLLLFVLTSGIAHSQNLRVTQIEFATDVKNRQPVDVDTAFAANVGSVYCYTQIEGAEDTTQIAHAWYYKDEEKARIELDVRSNDWRTWSSKTIQQSWTGPWRVMIVDADGNVLATKSFVIRNSE